MSFDRAERTRRSAEWAAFGDALGFMTELADTDRVQHRIGTPLVQDTTPWKRTIGSYNGVSVSLPAGTYSDDTQLRLSTARAIRADGTFDVAAFAKVELPAWANYALGAGVGTKEAAASFARTSATWYSNFFESKRAAYIRSGGNGAAMRVQPHVWAARDLSNADAILLDVVRNAVCTHGHPRGILGACFHALTLSFALKEGRAATTDEALGIVRQLEALPEIIQKDGDLRLLWLGAWEQANETSFEKAVKSAIEEMVQDIYGLARLKKAELPSLYESAVNAIGATEPTSRGSGTKTAILANFVSSIADKSELKATLLAVVNLLGSDTDSIATMAGAILGAYTEQECEGTLQDRDYIRSEAKRMAAIADGSSAESFRYPDLRSWKPARAAVDAVGLVDGHLWLNGLGALEPLERKPVAIVGEDTLGWYRLAFGQTILARVRSRPNRLSSERVPAPRQRDHTNNSPAGSPPSRLRDLFSHDAAPSSPNQNEPAVSTGGSLSEQLRHIIASGFSPEMIGRALLQQVDRGGSDFVERGIALTANILTAYEARAKRRDR